MKRPLSEIEKKFVEEANVGGFLLDYDAEGAPFALGAPKADNLFSMDVTETADGDDGAIYRVRGHQPRWLKKLV